MRDTERKSSRVYPKTAFGSGFVFLTFVCKNLDKLDKVSLGDFLEEKNEVLLLLLLSHFSRARLCVIQHSYLDYTDFSYLIFMRNIW